MHILRKLIRTYAKTLPNPLSSVPRQVLQRGEPPQRTGFSVAQWSIFQSLLLSPIDKRTNLIIRIEKGSFITDYCISESK